MNVACVVQCVSKIMVQFSNDHRIVTKHDKDGKQERNERETPTKFLYIIRSGDMKRNST